MPDNRSGSRWLRRLAVPVLLTGLLLVVPATAQAQSCSTAVSGVSGAGADFDGDGKVDLAIGDPDATVSGQARAGRVEIAYGNDSHQSITQRAVAGNDNAVGDRFGFTMDTVDWNGDGCTDLFVGVPFEDWSNNTIPDTGVVVFIPGSPAGLVPASAEMWSQADVDGVNVDPNEPTDRFGYSLAAGLDTVGEPYLVAGVPGEDGAVDQDGGNVVYARPGAARDFNQNSAGYWDSFEAGDMFGYSVAASESGFVVGVPGESAGAIEYAGTVFLIAHNDATTVPSPIISWGQGSPGINDHYETGDMYGYSLDMVDYISTGGGAPKMMIAVGAPGEMIGTRTSAGLSMVMWSPGTGINEYRYLYQDVDGNPERSERGDAFGAAVAMVNRTPGKNTSANTLLLTVGAPGEDADGHHEVGQAQVFSMIEDADQEDNPVRSLLDAAGLDPADRTNIGSVLHATKDYLWLSATGADGPAVYGVPWLNIVAGGTAEVKVHRPADFGLSAADVASFGASLA